MFCSPLFLLPSIAPSIRVFSNESVIWIRWPKYWWHQQFDGQEFEQAPGVGEQEGSLACCSLWGLQGYTWLSDWNDWLKLWSNSFAAHRLKHARFLCPWGFQGKTTGVGCHFLLQGIFPIQGWNLYLLHWQADDLAMSHQETFLLC